MPDLVAELVAIDAVPSLVERHRASAAARRAAYDAPWTEAVLRVLECGNYRRLTRHEPGFIARELGISLEHERRSLALLCELGVVRRRGRLYMPVQRSSIDTRGDPARVNALLEHWSQVGRDRISRRHDYDWYAYNVCSLSAADYERVRELLRNTFREIRALVAHTSAEERVALLNLQWLDLAPGPRG